MSQLTVEVWGLCPFMSKVDPLGEPAAFGSEVNPDTASAPEPIILAKCLGPGCGLWKITKVVDQQPVEGLCGIRFLGEVMNSIAGSLEQIVKRAGSKIETLS
jgi:hypothetical protein